ncbi:MAG TPA: S41 family peptidase [Thermoanaerobaculia bacterium]|nr:S41 family peptidase [Thermoanaerobaculia bacterium]
MPRRFLLALLILVTLSAGAAGTAPANFDFESGAPGEMPPGWLSPAAAAGYTAALSTETPKQGKQCVRLSGSSSGFGNILQRIDATPYRGKRVRLRAAVRVEGAVAMAAAALWMRVDRPEKQMGFFDNMGDRPIHSAEWAYYEIAGDVAEDAELLNLGMMLYGEGTAWLDDVTLETVAKLELRSGPPRALTPRGMENLTAFTRLFGLVRHFHPSDEAASADWEAVAVNGGDFIESAKDPAELAARLGDVFLPLAPSIRLFPTGAAPPPQPAKPADAQKIVSWDHHGWGQQQGRPPYVSERVRRGVDDAGAGYPDPLQPLRLDLGGGVSASIPLAVYADASRTLPLPTRAALSHPATAYTGNDRATRIGAVIVAWNVLQHFYPYFDVVDADWPAELQTTLRAAGTDRDEAAFARTLRRLVAALDDGHGYVQHPSVHRANLPVIWRVLGETLVITAVDAADSGLRAGDEVVAIDGKPFLPLLREAETLVSGATPQWRRSVALRELGSGPAGTKAVLTVRNADGSTRPVTLTRAARSAPLREQRPETLAELKPGIWYVDLERINDDAFQAAIPKLAEARGIVFDLRGYPQVGPTPLRHLIDAPAESARWNVPIVRRPDRAGLEWDTAGRWSLEPLQPRFTKNIAFLTDGRAISYAESWMGIVEAYKLGAIVGETTAGTNGNINTFRLPGDYGLTFTGMKVLKHDSSRHHGVGIAPTVPVSPTLAGIRAGRDEQLEKAIEILERNRSAAASAGASSTPARAPALRPPGRRHHVALQLRAGS